MTAPKAKSVRTDIRSGNAIVEFEDGHRMVFVPDNIGTARSTALKTLRLLNGDNVVASYESPYWHGYSGKRPNGGLKVAQSYSVERFTQYVQAARDYAATQFRERTEENSWGPWESIRWVMYDLEDLNTGQVNVVS